MKLKNRFFGDGLACKRDGGVRGRARSGGGGVVICRSLVCCAVRVQQQLACSLRWSDILACKVSDKTLSTDSSSSLEEHQEVRHLLGTFLRIGANGILNIFRQIACDHHGSRAKVDA